MRHDVHIPRSAAAAIAFDLFDPIPYGLFVGAFVFDVVYSQGGDVLWVKAAAWLIAMGLLFAVVPRLINLAQVWFRQGRPRVAAEMAGFWLHLVAIVAAIVNAFVHSRDAFAVMPEGLWLSTLTLVLLVLAKAVPALGHSTQKVLS